MISIGPDMTDVHSPDEKMKISSVGKFWDYLVKILEAVSAEKGEDTKETSPTNEP